MRRFLILIVSLIILGQLLTESFHVVHWLMGDKALIRYNLFIDKQQVPKGQNVLWYVKDLSVSLKNLTWVFCFGLVGMRISRNLMWVALVWMCYYLFDMVIYMYDYRRGYPIYVLVTLACIASTLLIFKKEKPVGKYIHMS